MPSISAAAVAVLLFLPSLRFGFLEYDDVIYVFESPLSGSLGPAALAKAFVEPYFRSYSPLTLLSHAVDLRLWGRDGGMHHLFNLLLHAANVVLVFKCGLLVLGGKPQRAVIAAFAGALLFAVHPLHVEPVAWISGRKELVMAFFLLISLFAYLRRPPGGGGQRTWIISVIAFGLALLSKSTAATFPFVLVVCDRLVLGRSEPLAALLREKWLMLVAALAAAVAATLAGTGHDTSDLLESPPVRLLLPVFTPAFYVWKALWPSGLTPYTPPPQFLWILLGAAATIALTIILARRSPGAASSLARTGGHGLLAAWLAYLLLLVPTVGGTFLETGMQPWADRYAYVPLIPVFFAAGALLAAIPWAYARAVFLIVAAVGYAAAARAQLPHWRDTEALWTRVTESSPGVAKGFKNLGSIRLSQGRTDEAIQLFSRAVSLKPTYSEAYNDLGLALAAAERTDEALDAHRKAIELDSSSAEGYNGYGIALLQMGDALGAAEVFRRGMEANPDSPRLRYNAGTAALALGDTAAAIARMQEASRLEPAAARPAEKAAQLLEARADGAAATWYARAAEAGSLEARAWLEKRGIRKGLTQ
jgi:Flp pilus assembly protein TadD